MGEDKVGNGLRSSLEKLAECPVCFELEGPPKTLKCGHAVCLSCIRKLHAKVKHQYAGKSDKKANKIKCPICRKKMEIPDGKVDNLGTNVAVNQMQKAIKESVNRADKVADLCRMMDKNLPEQLCKDCRKYMCSDCVNKHLKRQNYAEHTVVSARIVACRKHEGAQFDYFCSGCPRFLCQECHDRAECKHDILNLDDIEEESVSAQLDDLINQIKDEIVYNLEDHKPMIKTIKRKIDAAKETKEVIKKRTEVLIEMLKKEEDKLIKQVDKREKELEGMMETLHADDNLEVFQELEKGALQAKEMGDKNRMLMAVAALRSKLPPSPKKMADDRVHIYVKFKPEVRVNVGDVYMYFDAPRVLWEKGELGWGQDLTFTRTGCLAVVDYSRTKVLLFDKFGEIVADSQEQGVELKYPSSIIYHRDEDKLLISDFQAGVVKILDSHSLKGTGEIELEDTEKPYGLAVLSNGFLVATQIGRDQKTSIHDISGRLVKEWRTYGLNEEHKINYPWYVAVDSQDNILVSMDTPDVPGKRRHVSVYSNAGKFIKTVTVPEGAPWGLCGDDRGNILVTSFPNTLYHYTGDDMKVLDYKTKCGNIRSIALQGTRIALMYNHGLQLCLFRPE